MTKKVRYSTDTPQKHRKTGRFKLSLSESHVLFLCKTHSINDKKCNIDRLNQWQNPFRETDQNGETGFGANDGQNYV